MKHKSIKWQFSLGLILTLLSISFLFADSSAKYFTQKQGSYKYRNNIGSRGPDYLALGENVRSLAEFIRGKISIMRENKGFDLLGTLFGHFDDDYNKRSTTYGLRGELRMDFQLFLKEKGKEAKWTVEPPFWGLGVNNTESGHGGMIKLGKEGSLLRELFLVFPLVREIVPGVRYYDCEQRTCGTLVVYNPARPDFWLPVSVKEVVKAKLEYFKDDKMMHDFIQKVVSQMSREELDAPAHDGSEDGVLKVNGKGEGLQIMRFNEKYWDKSLKRSDIQFMTFIYGEFGIGNKTAEEQEAKRLEYEKNNGHPQYHEWVNSLLPVKELVKLLKMKAN